MYWVEVHCDTPVQLAPAGKLTDRCDRETFCSPGARSSSIRHALSAAKAVAVERGYLHDDKHGWQCAKCQKGRTYG